MNIDDLKNQNLIVLECISGSKAYGLDTKESDTDIKGVFVLPKSQFYGMEYIQQISNPSNDIVYYELGRFMQLLSLNNPNILELLNTPKDSIIYKHPVFDELNSDLILSKLCQNTFGKFALSQIKKAKGLNKKIVNPMKKKRKSLLDFCYINHDKGAIPLLTFLDNNNWTQNHCGLLNINHMKGVYGLYYNENNLYKGIIQKPDSTEICLSSVPKDAKQQALLYYNKDGFSSHCKRYKEYWQWVSNRNQARYENTKSHGKNYDSKNMMHTFRLLDMAIEIANEKQVNVHRPNRDFLLSIKNGEFEYDDLLALAHKKQIEMELAFEKSDLQDMPDIEKINQLLVKFREVFYC
ncbi:MAG: nucleotidyltransferase domain-containing protein [Marinicellaceae bacterium]